MACTSLLVSLQPWFRLFHGLGLLSSQSAFLVSGVLVRDCGGSGKTHTPRRDEYIEIIKYFYIFRMSSLIFLCVRQLIDVFPQEKSQTTMAVVYPSLPSLPFLILLLLKQKMNIQCWPQKIEPLRNFSSHI